MLKVKLSFIGRKFLRLFLYGTFLFLSVLFLLEMAYRFYLIDFYRPELYKLNPDLRDQEDSSKPAILVMGDSFTANPSGYIQQLIDSLPHYRVINSGISGSTIRQAALITPKRWREFHPEILIYQIYVGNDLLEFKHPAYSPGISKVRFVYWWLSERIHVLGFLNYRFRSLRTTFYNDLKHEVSPVLIDEFAPQSYSKRTIMHFLAEPYLLENAILLKRGRQNDMNDYLDRLMWMLNPVPEKCKVILMVVPHCAQVDAAYLDRMKILSAKFEESGRITEVDYPFIQVLQDNIKKPDLYLFNPLPGLRSASSDQNLFYENDPHLNIAGSKVLGKLLVEFLKNENITVEQLE